MSNGNVAHNLDVKNPCASDARGYPVDAGIMAIAQLAGVGQEMRNQATTMNGSFFPALVETEDTLKILDHHELPIGVSFRIIETAPLSPQKILASALKWSSRQVADAHAQAIDGIGR